MDKKYKQYNIITVGRLVDTLKSIGWGVIHLGCDTWHITDYKHKKTGIRYALDIKNDPYDTYLKPLNIEQFGSYMGGIRFVVDTIKIQYVGNTKFVTLHSGKSVISCYNHGYDIDTEW